jgi:DNA-binding SARP family transcriptional activator
MFTIGGITARSDPMSASDETTRTEVDTNDRWSTDRVDIKLLGGFAVSVNGTAIAEACWLRRTAASLVKVLALTPGHRLHREQVMDVLWPDEAPADAAPKLHKAAHYARRACGRDAVVLRNDIVTLFPVAEVTVDVAVFDELSRRAMADDDRAAAQEAIALYCGELLPADRYDEWAADRRELLRLRHLNVLRIAGRWSEVSELDPGDEDAHLELMRHHFAAGDFNAALLQFERTERILDRHLGVTPGPELRQLRDRIASAMQAPLVDALVAELAELTRRQAVLLETLTGAAVATMPTASSVPRPESVAAFRTSR